MRVLSLYDGMACGMLAFQSAGIEVERYDAYEIDKYAIKTATHNFPLIQEHGDVFKADFTQYRGVDFVIGGSPCTYWSIAQKNTRETEASGMGWELFSQYVRAIKEAEPKYFIYENNKSMSKEIRASIDKAFGFEAVFINSALVSAQNRQRLYWVGKRNADGTYSKVDIPLPQDRGILLKDILESGEPLRDKTVCIDANYYKGGNLTHFRKQRGQRNMVAERIPLYGEEGKSRPLSASYANKSDGESGVKADAFPDKQSKQVFDFVAEPINITSDGISSNTGLYAIPTNKPIYKVKDGYITIKGKQYPIKLADGYYNIRKLSITECKRLQTVPEWYEFPVSNTQAYKMLGNGFTIEVAAWLIQNCMRGQTQEKTKQISMFEEDL